MGLVHETHTWPLGLLPASRSKIVDDRAVLPRPPLLAAMSGFPCAISLISIVATARPKIPSPALWYAGTATASVSRGQVTAPRFMEVRGKRGVAQPGSAPEWGSGGRRFKSSLPDQMSHRPRHQSISQPADHRRSLAVRSPVIDGWLPGQ